MKRYPTIILFGLILSLSLTACGGRLTIEDAWARPALIDGNGAVYMTIQNGTENDDILLGALTDAAEVVELHDVVMKDVSEMASEDTENGGDMAMQMVKQEFVQVHAGETVRFEPGSLHVMLIGMKNNLIEGDTITLTLIFQNAGEVTIQVPVEYR